MFNTKTKIFNALRLVFRNRAMESLLYLFTNGRRNGSFITRLPANYYQYKKGSIRKVERNGLHYELDLSQYLEWIIYFGIKNEPRDQLYSLVKEGMVILDIGANIGETTLNFARLTGSSGKVYSFEPDSNSFNSLRKHIQLNHIENAILLQYALGEKEGHGYLNKNKLNNSGEDHITSIRKNDSDIEVFVHTLDGVIKNIEPGRIDLIKIDVEGFEKKILGGGEDTILKYKPILFIELDNRLLAKQNSSSSEIIRLLTDRGYSCYHAENNSRITPEYNFENSHFDIVCKYEEKRTIAYIISQIDHSVLFLSTAELLVSQKKWKPVFILLHSHSSPFEESLIKLGVKVFRVYYRSKKDVPLSLLRVRKILKKENIDIVHTHLFEAGLIGILAAKYAGIKNRIHTRHDAMIHHTYHPQAVKYDRLINRSATRIIAISEIIRSILTDLENVPAEKINVIHHGFDFSKMNNTTSESIIEVKSKYLKKDFFPVVGCISRLIEWKGVQYIIPAFEEFLKDNPQAHLIIANATGPYSQKIYDQLKHIPSESYTLIKFEPQVMELYKIMDVFIHVPVDPNAEAFGQVYVEAMYSGTPLVATKSGIGLELLEDGINALIVKYIDSNDIYEKLKIITGNEELRNNLSMKARTDVLQHFPIEKMMDKLNQLYESLD